MSPLMSYLLVGRVGTCTGSPAPPEWSVTGGSARVEEATAPMMLLTSADISNTFCKKRDEDGDRMKRCLSHNKTPSRLVLSSSLSARSVSQGVPAGLQVMSSAGQLSQAVGLGSSGLFITGSCLMELIASSR